MANTARPGRYAPVGFQQITSLSAATGVTVPNAANGRANRLIVKAETQNVRWRDDGTNPTTTVGMLLATTDPPLVYDGDPNAIKFIEVTTSASLSVTFHEDSRSGQ